MEQTRELVKSNLPVTNVLENSSVSCSLKLRQLLLGLKKKYYSREGNRARKIFGYHD